MQPESIKLFTLEEANQLLPRLTELIEQLQRTRNAIELAEVHIDLEEMLQGGSDGKPQKQVDEKLEKYREMIGQFEGILNEIHGHGCLLKDLDMGLVDFYADRNGKIVYLCWKAGESRIGHWHEIGSGFNHRQPL